MFLAKKYGARVINRKLNNNFSAQRNFAIKQAKEEWILFVDADETLNDEIIREIKKINNPNFESYYIKRRDKTQN